MAEEMNKTLLVGDLFCGAGGSSTGAELAIKKLGYKMVLTCLNHWPVAIETHKLNHPSARHYIEDIGQADPCKLVPEGYLDLLMASPECTHFSRARGGKPVNNQSRMNPWAVVTWLEKLSVRCLLIENVPEFRSWGPTDKDNQPVKEMRGIFFKQWTDAIKKLGYKIDYRLLNAADYGDVTTRERFFLIARKDGQKIVWPEPTHFKAGERLPKWRAASEIIEWGNLGRSLLDDQKYKKTPLSINTRRRIARGLAKFGGALAPMYIELLGLDDIPTPGDGAALPFIIGKNANSAACRNIKQPIPTATSSGRSYLIEPTLVQPVVLGQNGRAAIRSADDPLPTAQTHSGMRLASPCMVKYYGNERNGHSTEEPVPTITTKDRCGLASPVLVDVNHSGDGDRSQTIENPLGTVTTKRGKSLTIGIVEPVLEKATGEIDPKRLVVIDGETYLLDIRFRMLMNLELARAMGFTSAESTYEFVGNASEVTKQIGNAVPVNMAKALVTAILGDK